MEERQAERLEEKQNLLDSIEKAKRQLKKLLEVKDVADCVKKYSEDLSGIEKKTNLADVRSNLEQVISYKNEMRDKVFKKQADLSIQKEHISQEKQELEQKIERLMKKKLSYADEVSCVIESIREEFVRIGRLPAPRILCEMLEITDETWRNAVEGYLNTQRFYILVEPENFDIALGTYDRLRKEKKAYGVGLINTQKLDEYDVAPEGSLATVVTSKNKYAKRYINMILGKVVMCDNYQDLKKHRTSITRECMKYQNHVASAIKPSIFETPYIGQAAVKVQLDQARQKSLKLKAQLKELDDRIEMLQSVLEPLSTEHDMDIKYRIPVLSDLQRLRMEIHKCKENIATLEKNSGMIMKQVQLSALESLLQELASELDKLNRRAGNTEEHTYLPSLSKL